MQMVAVGVRVIFSCQRERKGDPAYVLVLKSLT